MNILECLKTLKIRIHSIDGSTTEHRKNKKGTVYLKTNNKQIIILWTVLSATRKNQSKEGRYRMAGKDMSVCYPRKSLQRRSSP